MVCACCCFEWFLFAVGINMLISVVLEVKLAVRTLMASNNLTGYGRGSWALVTACTDGIGQGFADALAKQGFNIIQVGRNPEKLKKAGSDIQATFGVQVKNIVKDFSLCAQNPIEFFNDIFQQTQGLDISILVNNVGGGVGIGYFHTFTQEKILNVLSLNLFPQAYLTRLYLPQLMERSQGSAIINLSSVASYTPMPPGSIYSATKGYDYVLSVVLSSELDVTKSKSKVDVMCLMPGFVDTPLTSKLKQKFLEITKKECAESALKCLGVVDYTNGHYKHVITGALVILVYPLRKLFTKPFSS